MRGWLISIRSLPSNLKPFYKHQFNLGTFNDCLLLGLRVIIPKKYHSSVLKLLHVGHPEITSLKSLFRLHVCWPAINADIEQTLQSCFNCQETVRGPVKVPLHQSDISRNPWQYLSTHWLCKPIHRYNMAVTYDAYVTGFAKRSYMCNYKYSEIQFWNIQYILRMIRAVCTCYCTNLQLFKVSHCIYCTVDS